MAYGDNVWPEGPSASGFGVLGRFRVLGLPRPPGGSKK